jgi:pimeloyl-ACP methyl ester carboxylesterase
MTFTDNVRGLPPTADRKCAHIDETTLAYRETGSGQPVVFVHGSISDLTSWDAQLGFVGARYRAVAYSRRYAWPNDNLPGNATDTIGPHVEDLLAFLRAVDAYPAHLVGNSWGALICLRAALRDPAAVRSLVLEEPAVIPLITGGPPATAQIVSSLLRHPLVTLAVLRFGARTLVPVRKLINAGHVEESVFRFARAALGDKGLARLPDQERHHMLANTSAHVGQFLAHGGFDEPLTNSEIRSINAPALVVTGAERPRLLHRLAALLASMLPNVGRLEVPAASHLMHLDNPDVLNAGLLRFLCEQSDPNESTSGLSAP